MYQAVVAGERLHRHVPCSEEHADICVLDARLPSATIDNGPADMPTVNRLVCRGVSEILCGSS